MKKLIVVRSGEPTPRAVLSYGGRRQMGRLAEALFSELGKRGDIRILSSTSSTARESAMMLATRFDTEAPEVFGSLGSDGTSGFDDVFALVHDQARFTDVLILVISEDWAGRFVSGFAIIELGIVPEEDVDLGLAEAVIVDCDAKELRQILCV